MRALVAMAAIAGSLALPFTGHGSVDPVFGYWQTANGRAIVEIAPCGAEACGRMVWLSNPVDDAGAPKRDVSGRPLCGIALVSGLEREAPGRWEDGEIYNPKSGQTFGAQIESLDVNSLEVRGYAAVPLLGKSQVWKRASGDRGGC